jgi:predicted ArsR family transcriptional regulator
MVSSSSRPTGSDGPPVSTQQLQARALGDPTRHRIFRYVADADRPIDVAELTGHIGLHHNAIRQHLTHLVAADLVTESTAAPAGRGRPRLVYQVAPSVDSRWGVTGPYEALSVLLTEIIRTGDTAVEVGRRAGSASTRPPTGDQHPADALVLRMARLGFSPVREGRGGNVDLVLQACPYETAALADPATVCGLHLGLALGLAESIGGIIVDDLVRQDPRGAHCRLRCHLDADGVDRRQAFEEVAETESQISGVFDVVDDTEPSRGRAASAARAAGSRGRRSS